MRQALSHHLSSSVSCLWADCVHVLLMDCWVFVGKQRMKKRGRGVWENPAPQGSWELTVVMLNPFLEFLKVWVNFFMPLAWIKTFVPKFKKNSKKQSGVTLTPWKCTSLPKLDKLRHVTLLFRSQWTNARCKKVVPAFGSCHLGNRR